MSVSERTPLVSNGHRRLSSLSSSRPPLSQSAFSENDPRAQESQLSIAQYGGDPANSSAFIPPEASQFSVALGGNGPSAALDPTVPERSRSEVLFILSALWIGTFLAAADGSIVATILAPVGSEFKVSKEVDWLGTSYLLTQTSFQPLYGRGADIFGRKAATLFASVIFAIGSLLCGLSRTFPQLCLARAFAGIGGGGLTTMATILTSDLVSLKDRGLYQGMGNLVFAFGAAIGAPLGGLFADGTLGWRFAFLLQVPICLVHFFAVTLKVDIPAGPGSMIEKIKRIDALGALSLVSAVTLILTGLSLGGNQRGWTDGLVIAALVGGFALLGIFVAVEKWVAKEPLMPLSVLFRRTPGFVALACWFLSMSQFGILFNVPLYLQSVEGFSASRAGLLLIPNAVIASACSLGAGLLIAKFGRYKNMLLIGGAGALIGPLGMCFWQRGVTPIWGYWLTMPWGGAGYGSVLTITLVALIASVDPAQSASATGTTYLARATGSVLGISLSSAILQNRIQHNLEVAEFPKRLIGQIRQDVSYLKRLQPDLREAATAALQSSFRTVFVAIALAGGAAFFALWPIPEHDLPSKKADHDNDDALADVIEEDGA